MTNVSSVALVVVITERETLSACLELSQKLFYISPFVSDGHMNIVLNIIHGRTDRLGYIIFFQFQRKLNVS